VIRIDHKTRQFKLRGLPLLDGYSLHFDCENDSKAFEGFEFAILNTEGYGQARSKWTAAEIVTGARLVADTTRKRVLDVLCTKALPVWPLYRMCLACRIQQCRAELIVQPPITDEFNALLVAAKMEGFNHSTRIKDIYATSNTATPR
jgi:hypothetical protein